MRTAERLTLAIRKRKLWRGGMRLVSGDNATRCISHSEAYCPASFEMIECLQHDDTSDSYWWVTVPDDAWVIDLEDAATNGALWGILRDAVEEHHDYASPRLDAEGVTLLNCWSVRIANGERIHTPGKGPWLETEPQPLAEALLMVWGER